MSESRTLSLAPLWAVLIWSGNTVVTKLAAGVIDPASMTFYRWLMALLILLPFAGPGLWAQRRVVAAHWPKLAVLGALGMAMYQGIAYVAAQTAPALDMGVILGLAPLMSALAAGALAGEALTAQRVTGALVSLVGLSILITGGKPWMFAAGGVKVGDFLMVCAVLSNALYSALIKRWALPLAQWEQLLAQIGFGILFIFPVWLLGPKSAVTAANLPLLLYAGLLASIGAPFFWIRAVKEWGAARASQFMNLLPVLVALVAWTFLGERPAWFHALGGCLVLAGVAVGVRNRPVRLTS